MRNPWPKVVRKITRWSSVSQHASIDTIAHQQQRFLYSPRAKWAVDRAWMEPYRDILMHDAIPAAGQDETRILDRRFTIVEAARSVRSLEGSTAECGVYRGVGSGLMCAVLDGTYAQGSYHFGFDSFEGLPAPTGEDHDSDGKTVWAEGGLTMPEEYAAAVLANFDFCRLIKGWIPQTLTTAAEHRFRFVHFDLDLYQSSLDALEFFYPRMVPRGVMLFDDYGLCSCPGARRAVDEFFAERPDFIMELTSCQALAVKC